MIIVYLFLCITAGSAVISLAMIDHSFSVRDYYFLDEKDEEEKEEKEEKVHRVKN